MSALKDLRVHILSATAMNDQFYGDIVVKMPVPGLKGNHCQITISHLNTKAFATYVLTGTHSIEGKNMQVGFLSFTFSGCRWTMAGKFAIDAHTYIENMKTGTTPAVHGTIVTVSEA